MGLASLRLNKLTEASRWLDKSMDAMSGNNLLVRGLNVAIRALVEHKMGNILESEQTLDSAKEIYNNIDKSHGGWHDVLFVDLLISEAEDLIQKQN